MTDKQKPRLTPVGRTVLKATYQGQVTYLPGSQIVIQRSSGDVTDVSGTFGGLMQAGWAFMDGYDLDNPPVEVPCHITAAGEDALMEAQQADRKVKAAKR